MTQDVSAKPELLLHQASKTAKRLMQDAINVIDDNFECGYAEKNPQLVAAFMQAATHDLHGAIIAQQIRAGLQEASAAIAQGIWDGAKYMGDQQG